MLRVGAFRVFFSVWGFALGEVYGKLSRVSGVESCMQELTVFAADGVHAKLSLFLTLFERRSIGVCSNVGLFLVIQTVSRTFDGSVFLESCSLLLSLGLGVNGSGLQAAGSHGLNSSLNS